MDTPLSIASSSHVTKALWDNFLTLSQILSVVGVNELAGAHSPVAPRKGHALAECRGRQPAFQQARVNLHSSPLVQFPRL